MQPFALNGRNVVRWQARFRIRRKHRRQLHIFAHEPISKVLVDISPPLLKHTHLRAELARLQGTSAAEGSNDYREVRILYERRRLVREERYLR